MHRPFRPFLALVLATGALVTDVSVRAAGDPSDINAARAGLAAYLDVNRPESPTTSTNIPGCPAIALDRLQQALGDVGMADTIEDWGTEIEWNEYEDIDPDLMGITCGGDADGDSHDGDVELSANVFAVDAGDADRAQEVLDHVGFGALEIEPSDVPGGELASTCVDDAEHALSLCMSFWTGDGFVLGVALASDAEDIPNGAASAVLVDTFDDIIATLGGPTDDVPAATDVVPDSTSPSDPPAPASSGRLDIAGARAGLATLLGDAPNTGPNEPLAECSVVGRTVVNRALETAGVDAPLSEWRVEVGRVDTGGPTWKDRGITCRGSYVGSDQDESFPELRLSLIVVDVGDSGAFEQFLTDAYPGATDPLPTPALGGATRGECAEVDRTDQCVEFWEQDGFVVGVLLADRVFVDRATASAVLNELVPAVVTSLTGDALGGATDDTDVLDGVTDELLTAAMVGLDELVGEFGMRPLDFGTCPILGKDEIEQSLTESGISIDLGNWDGTSSIVPNAAGDAVIPGVLCRGVDGDAEVQLFVNDFGDDPSADEFITGLHGCESVVEMQFCLAFGQRDGFVVGIGVLGADDIAEDDAEALLAEVVPLVLDSLAGAS